MIQVGTANFIDPRVTEKIIDGIAEYMDRHGVKAVDEMVGGMLV